ncbi:MAG: 30S ribosome-binding factor RbfA, partial [Gemmatimonadaceae bacterium]
MSADNRRPDRVAEAIREVVAMFLAEGVKDPRVVGLVTVTGVDVTRDLRHAKVFVSIMGSEAERAATVEGLASLAPHLRSRVGRALQLRLA